MTLYRGELERKWEEARADPLYAAAALMALAGREGGGDEDLAEVGALLVADFFANVRRFFGTGRT